MTNENEQHFKQTDKCQEKVLHKGCLCQGSFPYHRKYRGSAHQECNLKLKIKPEDIKIP